MSKSLEGFNFDVKPELTPESKAKLRHDPDAEREYVSLVFADKHFKKMEKALKVGELSDEYRERLQNLRWAFLLLHKSWGLAPPLGTVRQQLKKVSSDAAKLTKTLDQMKGNYAAESTEEAAMQSSLTLLKEAAIAEGLGNPDESMATLFEILNRVDLAAKRAISELPKGTPGRPRSLPLERLVWGLDAIFTEITGAKGVVSTRPNWTAEIKRSRDDKEPTGTGQYYGMILDFAEAFLLPLKEHFPMQRQTLGFEIKRIQKEVRDRKTKVG
jgi:hypothetical protein